MKKFFTLIIACIAAIAATAQTEGATATWGLTGEGTEANPYCIYTADDLYAMAKNCNANHKGTGEYFVLKNDIDFGGTAETPMQLPAIGGQSPPAQALRGCRQGTESGSKRRNDSGRREHGGTVTEQ